ncbi:MAG: thiamine phosphate synthase [Fulvivirga sp.]
MKPNKLGGGLYLVLNPAIDKSLLLDKLKQALEGGVKILQIWNNWPASFDLSDKQVLIEAIADISSGHDVPLLINEEWELLTDTAVSGVHFDSIPQDYKAIKAEVNQEFIAGITCGNDLKVVEWAEQNQLDYISFCAIFPSSSVDSCEIVQPETIRKARAMTEMPLFISGGITPTNMLDLKELDFTGVAVISGILNVDTPKTAALTYSQALKKLKI